MKPTLLETIRTRVLVGDGAMGTQLQQAGLAAGACGELWNLEHPDRVLAIQTRYVEAGSDCLLTNTFGGCRIMLGCAMIAVIVRARSTALVFTLHGTRWGDKPGFVLGDIGPCGGLMEPYGEMPEARVREAFAEQAEALVDGGVDAIVVETQTSLAELGIAIQAAEKAGAACIVASLAYDVTFDGSEIRTMMGVDPEQAAAFVRAAGADVVALNCGTGIDAKWAARCVARYRAVCDLPTMAQPNAGTPVLENFVPVYKQTPAEMAADVPAVLAADVNILGACCGSGPEHIRKIRELVDAHNAKSVGAASG